MKTYIYEGLSMFWYYGKNSIKSWFQYKVNACIQALTVFLREMANVVVIYLTLMSFDAINGWDKNDLLFLFSLVFLTYGILIIFFTGLRDFEGLINNGTFDRFILRPRGLLFQVIASNADWFAALGHGGLGIMLFIVSAGKVGIKWQMKTILFYIAAVVGGTLIQGGLFLIFATCSFFFIKTENIREVLYWNIRKFAGYPISIFPRLIQYVMIYVIPFAFVSYFPAQYLLRKPDLALYPACYIYLTPLVGLIIYLLAYAFWRFGLKRYTSTGN